jgi:hypothetical protein
VQRGVRRFNGLANPRHSMCLEVVHDDNIARTQLRSEDLVDVAAKHRAVRAALHGHRRHESPHAQRANPRHGPAPIARLSGIRALAAWCPGMGACQIDMTAGFIDKDQLLHLLLSDQLLEGGPSLAPILGILFGGMKGLFFRVSPRCLSARCIVVRPMCTGAVAASCSQRSAREASGCW